MIGYWHNDVRLSACLLFSFYTRFSRWNLLDPSVLGAAFGKISD